jgi:Protein of unknown function (DUF2934)
MSRATEAEQAYRKAFEQFSKKVQQVQVLTALINSDPRHMETALLELERAHEAYNVARDEWVQHLLPAASRAVPESGHASQHSHEDCVRAIAELLWEGAGRPEGTAAENWRKAEEIVKLAATAA